MQLPPNYVDPVPWRGPFTPWKMGDVPDVDPDEDCSLILPDGVSVPGCWRGDHWYGATPRGAGLMRLEPVAWRRIGPSYKR